MVTTATLCTHLATTPPAKPPVLTTIVCYTDHYFAVIQDGTGYTHSLLVREEYPLCAAVKH